MTKKRDTKSLCKLTQVGHCKIYVKWLGSIEKGEIKPKQLTQLGRCNLCLWTTAGYSNKLTTGGEYYPEHKLKMVNKLYANISFCLKSCLKAYVISTELHQVITSLL